MVEIQIKHKSRGISVDKFKAVETNIKNAFGEIKEEFSDHLKAINENTNEIQLNYEYLCEIENKVDKLTEKIDELSMFFKHMNPHFLAEKDSKMDNLELTEREREVFFALYSIEEEQGFASFEDISSRLNMPESFVQAYVSNLFEKGVPIIKNISGNSVTLTLEDGFKTRQRQENIVGISQLVSEKVMIR